MASYQTYQSGMSSDGQVNMAWQSSSSGQQSVYWQPQPNGMEPPPAYSYNDNKTWGTPNNQVAPVLLTTGGVVHQHQEPYQEVPNRMCLGIVSLFFCLCFGIVSVLAASTSRTQVAKGRYKEALRSADRAKKYAIIAIALGIFLLAVNIVVEVVLLS